MLGIFSEDHWPSREERPAESWLRFLTRLVFLAVVAPSLGLTAVAILMLAVSWKAAFAAGIATILLCAVIIATLLVVVRYLIGIMPPPV